MKKVAVVVLATALLMLVLAVMPAVSAKPNRPLKCEVELSLDLSLPGWSGGVTGDIEGTIAYTLDLSTLWVSDGIEHFRETWVIATTTGTISGFNEGIYMQKNNWMWVANGEVTGATGAWAYLVGCNEHEQGTTTPFDWGGTWGTGTLMITAG